MDIRVTALASTAASREESIMNRAETLVSSLLDAIHGVIVEHDVTYEEYRPPSSG